MTDGTWTYTWQNGRELASMTDDTTTWNYTYDANGMRVSRTNGTKTYNYVYNGSQLTQMTVGNNPLNFAYDASGIPMTVTYNDWDYYYITNLQGDVMGIADSTGTIVVNYTYDAWGKPLSITGPMANTLGVQNPLRYRGYVYDQDTGLYYVSSRYYDPEIGRWVNADDVNLLGANGDFVSYNLFAYCGNNPVSRKDETGYFWNYVIGAAVSAAVNVVTTYIAAKATGQEYTLKDAAVAAISGAVNVIPVVGTVLSGAITGTYTGVMAYNNGASVGASIGAGLVAGICTTASIGNLANATGPQLSVATNATVDLVFGTGYNSMAAATYKAVTNTPIATENKTSSKSKRSSSQEKRNRAVSILERSSYINLFV